MVPEDLEPGRNLLQTLQSGQTALDHDSAERLETALAAALDSTDSGSAALVSADGSRMISVETRQLNPELWLATFEDASPGAEAHSKLARLALIDPLTGLGNRAGFEQSLASALARRSENPVAILMIDLDRFKAVNDTLGHAAGDAVLRLVGERLTAASGDCGFAARLGGDEFALLFSDGRRPAELAGLAGRIIDLLQRTFLVNGNTANIGASIGIAVSPGDGADMAALLKSADLALYHSKDSGRGSFHFFDQSMEQRARARRNMELELRKALPLRQMDVFYRPQVDTASEVLLGFEALLRWRHPQRGLLTPEVFAPLADELGLTSQIGDWMLRTACRQAAKWPDRLTVCFSASWRQFESGRLIEVVTRSLEAAGLPGHRLEIQVTEDVLLRNEKQVLGTLHDLRVLGVQVAMDDFGTGYASLSQLANFPFDRVKINRSLLVDGAGNARHRAIVRGIAALGASLGIVTVGEGIENPAELARIHSDGCSLVRGYLPTEGLPEHEARQLICAAVEPIRLVRGSPVRALYEGENSGNEHLQSCVLQP